MNNKSRIQRIYVQKRQGFDIEGKSLSKLLKENLGLDQLKRAKIYHRYDVSGLTSQEFELAVMQVLSQPAIDDFFAQDNVFADADLVIAVEPLPGQFDQRADSAAQSIQILTGGQKPLCKTAKIYCFYGEFSAAQKGSIKEWLINPVEAREASMAIPLSLEDFENIPETITRVEGLTTSDDETLEEIRLEAGLAMSAEDLKFIRTYFQKEGRDPTWTELRVLDTYWSDHCRHTTFLTEIENIIFESDDDFNLHLQSVLHDYRLKREQIYGEHLANKPECLMDLATIGMKYLRTKGKLDDLDESDEINACSIKIEVEIDGKPQDYLLMFKNETHNHPTEIEPFGGAATCLGGAIRDPLSGRSYVYQAMRVTGSGDPTVPVEETLKGKLPQLKLTYTAAQGYSSYGNQIGIAAGQTAEIYHPGYVAKRMELGAVIATAPANQVRREAPEAGDVVILVGGRTGRDGCGGATGSSKVHTEESLLTSGAEVQKGNPPTERYIQRLFRKPEVSLLIKKCNDFGAGGVSVAIGELAPGLEINLDLVPTKYAGLDGTELAISESQERMAVVVSSDDASKFIAAADAENLEAIAVARVTEEPRMVLTWRGQKIVNLARDFIDSNGAAQYTQIKVPVATTASEYFLPPKLNNYMPIDFGRLLHKRLNDLTHCSRKGLTEMFDSSVGANTVLMPLGGQDQLTAEEGMVSLIPVLEGTTKDSSFMAFGFDPYLSEISPFHGAYYAVLHSLSKLAVMGADPLSARLSFQEYFEGMTDPVKWSKPLLALLGAYQAQLEFETAAIGGKDSMSGSFNDLHVPPTLVSFAVAAGKADHACSAALQRPGLTLWLLDVNRNEYNLPDICDWREKLKLVNELQERNLIEAAATVDAGGIAVAIVRQCLGNRLGFVYDAALGIRELFTPRPGAILLAVTDKEAISRLSQLGAMLLGQTSAKAQMVFAGQHIELSALKSSWQQKLEKVFPLEGQTEAQLDLSLFASKADMTAPQKETNDRVTPSLVSGSFTKPRVLIPVFPGTNGEYETEKAFAEAGAQTDIFVIRNLSVQAIQESLAELAERMSKAQILMLPGGASAGDEPDGAGKLIAAILRQPQISEQIRALYEERKGLILGIGNGFQALVSLGLLPFGEIRESVVDAPILTYNLIGRHVSSYVNTKIIQNHSPWLALTQQQGLYKLPLACTQGRFTASEEIIKDMFAKGQVAAVYTDGFGNPSSQSAFNPTGSMAAIEGITSIDGRIFGKMGHSERVGQYVATNIPGQKDQQIFLAGVNWFK